MGEISNAWCEPGSDIVCLEGNGARPSHLGDGYKVGGAMYTLNTTEVHAVCYGISPYHSNGMLSSNPHSGIYEANTSRTLDLNGGNPGCHQGGGYALSRYTKRFDARGNGKGYVSPTITGDHQNRITDYTAIVVEIRDDNDTETILGCESQGDGDKPNHRNEWWGVVEEICQ